MNKDKSWDMGHLPDYEFRKHKKSAEERGITREQFLDEHNNPDHYRPELPSSNRSHKGEDLTDDYFGDWNYWKLLAKDRRVKWGYQMKVK